MDKILELKKLLDPVIEDVYELLRWKSRKEWCDENIQKAKNIVRDVESDGRNRDNGKWREWRIKKFEPCLKEYQQAVDNKDFERIEEIAYGDLPGLFSSAEEVKVWYKTREGEDVMISLPQLVGGGPPPPPGVPVIPSKKERGDLRKKL
jgi:hypothetical protein